MEIHGLLCIAVFGIIVGRGDSSFLSGVSLFLSDADHHESSPRQVGLYADLRRGNIHEMTHRTKRNADSEKPQVKTLHMESQVMSRFGQTLVYSEISNPYSENRDATFSIQIPETAFISNYTMVIDGEYMVAEVKSKEEADKLYEEAKNKNKTAGKVSSQMPESRHAARGMELFAVSVTVKAKSSISFELYYLETLVRKLGVFEYRLSVRPNQIVEKLTARVLIHEEEGITLFDVFEPSLDSNSLVNVNTQVNQISDTTREVTYQPSITNQQSFSSDHGISGDLIIRYDMNHKYNIGSVHVDNGYFVHHFSPDHKQMTILDKNIIFVIDISGSMSGRKMDQTRESMLIVLEWLNSGDKFMIILFDSKLVYWPTAAVFVAATSDNIQQAKSFVREKVHSRGSTNINLALVDASNRFSEIVNKGGNIIVFLTDGRPSAGETQMDNIVSNVVQVASGKLSIYCLGYGFDLNYELLERISFRTQGYTVRIYEENDAAMQLENFFLQINNPLLFNIKFDYLPTNVIIVENEITTTSFSNYFNGSEITVAGKLQASVPNTWQTRVVADAGIQRFQMEQTIDTTVAYNIPQEIHASKAYTSGFIEKLYVYMKIKDFRKQELIVDDANQKEDIRKKAIKLAIEFNLVTPYTSMIIVQKDREQDLQLEADRASKGVLFSSPGSSKATSPADSLRLVIYLLCFLFFLKYSYQ